MATGLKIILGAKDNASSVIAKVTKGFKSLAKTLALPLAGGLGFTAIAAGFKQAADEVANLDDQIKKTKLSARDFQVLKFAAEENGASIDQLTGSLVTLERRVQIAIRSNNNYRAALKDLGISVHDLAGMTQKELVVAIAKGYAETDNFRALADLLDKGAAASLKETLKSLGDEGFGSIEEKAQAAAAILEDDLIDTMAEAQRKIELFQERMKNITIRITAKFVPDFDEAEIEAEAKRRLAEEGHTPIKGAFGGEGFDPVLLEQMKEAIKFEREMEERQERRNKLAAEQRQIEQEQAKELEDAVKAWDDYLKGQASAKDQAAALKQELTKLSDELNLAQAGVGDRSETEIKTEQMKKLLELEKVKEKAEKDAHKEKMRLLREQGKEEKKNIKDALKAREDANKKEADLLRKRAETLKDRATDMAEAALTGSGAAAFFAEEEKEQDEKSLLAKLRARAKRKLRRRGQFGGRISKTLSKQERLALESEQLEAQAQAAQEEADALDKEAKAAAVKAAGFLESIDKKINDALVMGA